MNEEEKKAIVLLRELRGLYEVTADDYEYRGTLSIQVDEDDSDAIETILNLVEKQQNEIASKEKQIKLMQSCDLAKVIKEQQNEIDYYKSELEKESSIWTKIEKGNDYISKDKIREFIKEELPDDEIMKCCERYDINGIYIREKLEKLL